MAKDQVLIDPVRSAAARKRARRRIASEGLPEDLEEFIAVYDAATRSGLAERAALEAAAGLSRNGHEALASSAETIDEFLAEAKRRPHDSQGLLAGLHDRMRGGGARCVFDGRVYSPSDGPLLVGVDEQSAALEQAVQDLLAYSPSRAQNARSEVRDSAVLLFGPPGTGKSSLSRHAVSYGRRLSGLCGFPLRYESFGPSDFSKWVGESSKALSQKFSRLEDPSGVGLLVIDDIDMVLQSREEQFSSTGMLHVTSELMQRMSGLYAGSPNSLVIATTNRPDQLDAALLRRFTARIEVPLYDRIEQYVQYVDARLGLSGDAAERVAQYGLEHGLSPAEMDSLSRRILRASYPSVDESVYSLGEDERFEALSAQDSISEGLLDRILVPPS